MQYIMRIINTQILNILKTVSGIFNGIPFLSLTFEFSGSGTLSAGTICYTFLFLFLPFQGFEYGAFGISTLQISSFVLYLIIAIIFIISTVCQMYYIFCWA